MGVRLKISDRKHVHIFGTHKIKKVCKKCHGAYRVIEKCLDRECQLKQKAKLACKCGRHGV